MALPATLVDALTTPGGGRIVLVVGAGCSIEAPTNLRLSSYYSADACRRLIQAGLLDDGDCEPTDLSSVADAVVAKHGHQAPLVERLPRNDFRSAAANRGYLIAAALLREGIVKALVTLNYDLAIVHALGEVSTQHRVAVIGEPRDHAQFGSRNVVFLHRNAFANPESWVMTTQALERDWQDGWESIMTLSLVASPVTVFAGLGSRAAVLTESIKRLHERPGTEASSQFLVGLSPSPEGNDFFEQLDIDADHYIAAGWCGFMNEVSTVVASNQVSQISRVCEELCSERSWEPEDEHFHSVLLACSSLDLLGLGRVRARWQLSDTTYMSEEELGEFGARALAELVMAAGHLHRLWGGELRLHETGAVELWSGERRLEHVTLAHGGGTRSLDFVKEKLMADSKLLSCGSRPSRRVLVGGLSSGSTPLPEDLAGQRVEESLVIGPDAWAFLGIDTMRSASDLSLLPWEVSN